MLPHRLRLNTDQEIFKSNRLKSNISGEILHVEVLSFQELASEK